MAIKLILPTRGGGRNRSIKATYAVLISSTRSKTEDHAQVCIYFSLATMKELRWLIGDRVAIKFDDESNMMTLFRNGSGFMLSSKETKHGTTKTSIGKCLPAAMRFANKGLPLVSCIPLNKEDCIFGENELSFIYPDK